ncbi:CpsB/CapC family capsule biosynthesis tyrosine phosphatase [uncultured Dysosmobacter sp.]|uniref:CpsB/CapC family capsule biosynthesis tyrosine phosphatase n=1 Tax=uncultured Dysosmobacter sp. TaxID=2591384 RepID=UPI0026065220|nr:CpsB/CapC family capsule biosynthesis tyrosine phosphatase [uncultured Dysosmobacter sp.]
MTDIHCHVLPQMDDGSRSAEESLAMLEALAAQGVDCAAATPHFYADENSPEEFLDRRAAAAEKLAEVWHPGLPALKLGAEVCYFEGISQCKGLDALQIEDTGLLLLEMPYCRWSRRMLQEIFDLQLRPGMRVLLAHTERYLHWLQPETWEALLEWGVLNQCNASFFLRWQTKRKAIRMLREGRIHLLGTDSHDMDDRSPRLEAAWAVLGQKEREILKENVKRFLPGWEENGK